MIDDYSNLFFENINNDIRYDTVAKFFSYNLSKHFNINSVVDVGGATGLNISYFDVPCKICIDGSINAKKYSLVDFYLWDLTTTFPNLYPFNKKYDLVMCVEVAEHINELHLNTFIRNIISLGDLVFFTAAVPGQSGLFHKNLQKREYWIKKFNEYNYYEDYNFIVKLKEKMMYYKNIPYWFRLLTSLFLFKKM